MENPAAIYLRLITYDAKALTSNGTYDDNIATVTRSLDIDNKQFIKIGSYNSDVEQVLNIGSQSSGAGAGKIQFNPFRITKFTDAISPVLFVNSASGKAFRTAEVFFTSAKNVVRFLYTHKLVAIKSVAWSAVEGGEGMMESVSFEYGGLVITIHSKGKTDNISQGGWNRVKNINDNDLNSVIS